MRRGQFISTAFEAAAASSDLNPTESYSVVHRLTGHESDVNGLEWSADGKYLASCGLDGSVIIWDASNSFAQVKRLDAEPRKPLKGLVWDPLGQYLASQSSDGVLLLWRCEDWKLDTTLTSPYAEPVESYTYFSRPSWSPDGRVICVPDAINESETVAMLVERSQWSIENCLVGHVSSVQSAKFSPRVYKDSAGDTFLLIALGSQDGVLSLWSSVGSKPLVVLAGLFEHAIMDLVWSSDGQSLFAVSYDGTATKILVNVTAIGGIVLNETEQSALLSKLEKQPVGSLALPTSVNQIMLRNRLTAILQGESIGTQLASPKGPAAPTLTVQGFSTQTTNMDSMQSEPEPMVTSMAADAAASLVTAAPATAGSTSPQVERRLKNGKRRITPQLLQPATPMPGTCTADKPRFSTESYSVIIGKPARKSWLRASPIRGIKLLKSHPEAAKSEGFTLDHFSIELVNVTTRDSSSVKISQSQDRKLIWEDRLDGQATCAALTGSGLLLVGLGTHKLVTISQAGRRLMPTITLSATPTVIAYADDICAVILDNGSFHIWYGPSWYSSFYTCIWF